MVVAPDYTSNLFSRLFVVIDAQLNFLRVAIALVVALIAYNYHYTRSAKPGGIYKLSDIPVLTAWTFFNKSSDFLWSHFKHNELFQFRLFDHKVVAVSGEEGRKVFFGTHHLNFSEGYKIFSTNKAPSLTEIEEKTTMEDDLSFKKTVIKLIHKDRLKNALPTLLADINKRIESWGDSGKVNPFVDVHKLVFQTTARFGTCQAISDDVAAVDRIADLFMKLQTSQTPTTLVLPHWFPSHNRKMNKQATSDLYVMLRDHVEARRKEPPTSDTIDVLIGDGIDTNDVVQTILGILFAGVVTTGRTSCWILIELALHPEWKAKVHREATDLVNNHVGLGTSVPSLHERLASVPLSAWEDELPILDHCIRETIRLHLHTIALRRNIYDDLRIGDKVVDKGAFIAYSIADVHFNRNIYSNPEMFDPDRFRVRAEDANSQTTYPYLGWGAGRHPCAGMRFAKLEMKLIIVLFLLGFESNLVDDEGKFPNPLPRSDRNNTDRLRPVGKPCYFQYKRTMI